MSRLSTRQYNAKSGMGMLRKLYTKMQLKVLSCELMLKMTELLDRSKYPHVWNCWGLKNLKSVWCSWGAVVLVCPACIRAKGGWEGCLELCWLHALQAWGGDVRNSPWSSHFPRLSQPFGHCVCRVKDKLQLLIFPCMLKS